MWRYENLGDYELYLSNNYPVWNGYLKLPYGPDAALYYNDTIHVFKNDQVYLVDEVDTGLIVREGYPKSLSEVFKVVGC